MNIRVLNQQDWQVWKDLRLEALQNAPEAFGTSYKEAADQSDEEFQANLVQTDIFGAFVNSDMVGCGGFSRLKYIKMKHRGILYGMYIKPEFRGQGIADQLIEAVIAHAQSRVTQLHVTCVTTNPAAVKLYEKHGFSIYGTEPRSLKIGDQFYDEYLMVRKLK
jgi:ribosomal protein S18 acetylase RimI-like enzyme